MEEEEEVLATVDVVLTRSPDPGGALYVLQSPLRPVDRPYNLDTCDSIDVKVRTPVCCLCLLHASLPVHVHASPALAATSARVDSRLNALAADAAPVRPRAVGFATGHRSRHL